MSRYDTLRTNDQSNYTGRPHISSYDSGYEHSIEHLLELRLLVEEIAEDSTVIIETGELVEV